MEKIMIVDDDTDTTTLLKSILKMNGFDSFSVNESRNALKAIESTMPDLILLDIMMAEINGITLCKLIKSDPIIKHIPVIMVSALSDDGTKRDSANAGAIDFITKPIHAQELVQRIRSTLGGQA